MGALERPGFIGAIGAFPRRQNKSAAAAVRDMSFEAALKELETIVARLEQGEVDLEDSIAFTNAARR